MASKKNLKIGVAAIAAAGAGAAIAAKNYKKSEKNAEKATEKMVADSAERQEYRNTERGLDA